MIFYFFEISICACVESIVLMSFSQFRMVNELQSVSNG